MNCANLQITGTDEESGEDYDVTQQHCVVQAGCDGWTGETNGATITILNCDLGASKVAAGFAAMVVAAYAM